MELNLERNEWRGCPFCGGPVEFDGSIAIYNRLYKGKCSECGMMFAYQEEHEHLEVDFKGLEMKAVYYSRYVQVNKPFHEVWNRRVNDEQAD